MLKMLVKNVKDGPNKCKIWVCHVKLGIMSFLFTFQIFNIQIPKSFKYPFLNLNIRN